MKKYVLLIVSMCLVFGLLSAYAPTQELLNLEEEWKTLVRQDMPWDSKHPSPPDPVDIEVMRVSRRESVRLTKEERDSRKSLIQALRQKRTPEQKARAKERYDRRLARSRSKSDWERVWKEAREAWDELRSRVYRASRHGTRKVADAQYDKRYKRALAGIRRLIDRKKAYLAARLEIHVAYMKRHGSKQ